MAFAAAQMSYLVDLGMRPDADDSAAEEFARHLSPEELGDFERIAGEQPDDHTPTATTPATSPAPVVPPAADDIERQSPAPLPTDVADIVRRELEARETIRRERLDFIREQSGADVPNELIQRALIEEWPQERVAREFLTAVRTRPAAVPSGAPAGHSRAHETDCTLQSLQGALLLRNGFALDDPLFARAESRAVLARDRVRGEWISRAAAPNATIDEATARARDNAHQYAGRSLVEICREALRLSNRPVPADNDDMIRRALSTATLDAVFSPSVNMMIIASYIGVEDTTAGWTRPTELRDFKIVERGRLTKASGLKKLARGGTPNPIEYSDEVESYKLARYAGKFEISEEDIIDDSFGALSEHTARELGELAAELRANLVYSILFANAAMRDGVTLFHASHGNSFTAALDLAGLDAMKVAMATQSENDRSIRNTMRYLIVPERLDFTARQLLNSTVVINGSSSKQEGTFNPLANRFTVVSDPRLDVGVMDPTTDSTTRIGGSATRWFGASEANAGSIEVAYRQGTGRAPRMTSYLMPSDRYGMGWKVDLDIAAKAIDWRSLAVSAPG